LSGSNQQPVQPDVIFFLPQRQLLHLDHLPIVSSYPASTFPPLSYQLPSHISLQAPLQITAQGETTDLQKQTTATAAEDKDIELVCSISYPPEEDTPKLSQFKVDLSSSSSEDSSEDEDTMENSPVSDQNNHLSQYVPKRSFSQSIINLPAKRYRKSCSKL
jgi:hypothetical protein